MIDSKTPLAQYLPHADASGLRILDDCRNHIAEAKTIRAQLINEKSSNAIEMYNDIMIHLDSAINPASLISQVHPDEKIRKEAELCEQEASNYATELSLDRDIYNVLAKIDNNTLDTITARMHTLTLRDFRRAGVDKDAVTREKIKSLKNELVLISQEFAENIRKDRFVIELSSPSDLAGLPEDYIKSHAPDANKKIYISTDYPDYIPFMKYAKSDTHRKALRHKYLNRGSANETVLRKMIEKRYELARLLGYSSYADYVAEDKMIKEASAIYELVDKVSDIAKAGADKEYQALLEYKRRNNKAAKVIEGFESAYIEEGFKKEHFKFDSQSVRPYFSYPRVRDGILKLTTKLFGLRYEKVPNVKVWHNSVEVFDVFDETGKLGRIFLDMHPREGKYKHAAQFTLRSGIDAIQYPEAVLVCNFPNPTEGDGFALMEHNEVVTFFHEFGHLLHHIFAGRQPFVRFSGSSGPEWDFVEAPSQLFEEWAWSPEVLKDFAKHFKTNEPIPENLVLTMRAAEEFGKAIHTRQQMFYAALSINYYDNDPKDIDLLKMLKDMQAKYSYYPYEEGTRFYLSFGHLDGYSSAYYTYTQSLILSKDMLKPFVEAGLMDTKVAKHYRDTVLRPGGAKDAKDLVENFLGRPYSFEAFRDWLTKETLILAKI